jgi:hypothetical protein
MEYTDEQINEMADGYAEKAPELDYQRPGIFANGSFLLAFDNREARILQGYAASHNTTPSKLIGDYLSTLAAQS